MVTVLVLVMAMVLVPVLGLGLSLGSWLQRLDWYRRVCRVLHGHRPSCRRQS